MSFKIKSVLFELETREEPNLHFRTITVDNNMKSHIANNTAVFSALSLARIVPLRLLTTMKTMQ